MRVEGWRTPDALPKLGEGEVQVWRVELEGAGVSRQEIGALLSLSAGVLTREERERAARMRAGRPREEFIVGRGCLRTLLGEALDAEPRALVIEAGEHGKPELAGRSGQAPIWFNVAHSGGVILIALSRGGRVGVDVELVDPAIELVDVARNAFTAAEFAAIIGGHTPEDRLRQFYAAWTRREAVAKADGRGLTLAPETFAADGRGEGLEFRLQLPVGAGETSGALFVQMIEAGPRHMAALATDGPERAVDLYRLPAMLLALAAA